MTSTTDNTAITPDMPAIGNSLIEQSQALRQQLRVQRKLIQQQIDPASSMDTGYPRSLTMRFLTQRPALVAGVVTEVATLLLGARFLKSAVTALSVARVVRSSAIARQEKQLPSP